MNNSKPPLSYTFARGSIMYFSWVALIAGTILLVCTVFNIPPYIDFGDDLVLGFSDYKKGVPVEGTITSRTSQTIIGGLGTIKFFVKNPTYFQKLLLVVPEILFLFIIGFGCRQIAKMLDTIQEGKPFINANYTRIRNIGWLIIGFQIFTLITGLIRDRVYDVLSADFTTSGGFFTPPLELRAVVENGFSVFYFVGGVMLLVVARAFKAGEELQKEKALTI